MARRARNPKAPKTTNLTARCSIELKQKLEQAAKDYRGQDGEEGRSFSAEVTARLEASFKRVPTSPFRGQEQILFTMVALATNGLSAIGPLDGTFHWLKHPYIFRLAKRSIDVLLEYYRPEGSSKAPRELLEYISPIPEPGESEAALLRRLDKTDLGELYATSIINEIATRQGSEPPSTDKSVDIPEIEIEGFGSSAVDDPNRLWAASSSASRLTPNMARFMARLALRTKLPTRRKK